MPAWNATSRCWDGLSPKRGSAVAMWRRCSSVGRPHVVAALTASQFSSPALPSDLNRGSRSTAARASAATLAQPPVRRARRQAARRLASWTLLHAASATPGSTPCRPSALAAAELTRALGSRSTGTKSSTEAARPTRPDTALTAAVDHDTGPSGLRPRSSPSQRAREQGSVHFGGPSLGNPLQLCQTSAGRRARIR